MAFRAAPFAGCHRREKSATPLPFEARSARILPPEPRPRGRLARAGEVLERMPGAAASSSRVLSGDSASCVSTQTDSACRHHGHPDTRGAHGEARQLQDLPGLGSELCLLVELLAVEVPVHLEVSLTGSLRAEALIRCVPAPEAGLVGGDLTRARRRRRAAASARTPAGSSSIRVGDDAVVPRALAPRSPRVPRAGLPLQVGRRATCRSRSRRHEPAWGTSSRLASGADGEQAKVRVSGGERVTPSPLRR